MHFGTQSQNNKRALNVQNNHQNNKKSKQDSDITAAEILKYLQTSGTINVEKIKQKMRQSTSSTPQKENNEEHESVHNDSKQSKTKTDTVQSNGILLKKILFTGESDNINRTTKHQNNIEENEILNANIMDNNNEIKKIFNS